MNQESGMKNRKKETTAIVVMCWADKCNFYLFDLDELIVASFLFS